MSANLTVDEARALIGTIAARDQFLMEQIQPGTAGGTASFRSAALQSALDKLSDLLDAEQ